MKFNSVKQIAVAVVILCAAGCSKNEQLNTTGGALQSKTVQVEIDFSVDDFVSPDDDGKAVGTKSTSKRVINSDRSGGMYVELVESPIGGDPASATRGSGGGGVIVEYPDIFDVWVFQYDGTEATSKLVRRTWRYFTTEEPYDVSIGTNQRLVVVGNSGETFGNDQIVGSSTYQDLREKTKTITDEASLINNNEASLDNKHYAPISGTTIVKSVETGTKIRMELTRNISTIKFRVALDPIHTPKADSWTIQLCDVPNICYWALHSDLPSPEIHPADNVLGTPVNYELETIPHLSALMFSEEFQWSVPMNRRGIVKNALPQTRKTYAPAKSTYVKVSGIKATTDVYGKPTTTTTTYTIHLGANFVTDYNIDPNRIYTYYVMLYIDPSGSDSRVETVVTSK